MKRRKKIFKPKRHYRIKRRNEKAVKIISAAVALAALVFVGYSVAAPVSRYLASRSERTESEPWSPTDTDTAVVTEITLPEDTARTEQPQQTEQAQASETVPVQTTASSEPAETTAATEPAPSVKESGPAYMIDPDFLSETGDLESGLDDIQNNGYSAVVFPMKTEGGYFRYATKIELAHTVYDGNDPILSPIPAEEMVKAAQSRGLRPVALISVLYDNNRYGDYRDGAYRGEDDDTWLDGSPDKGGKPWLSPFDETAQEYLCDIIEELSEAGFKEIICDDYIFPEFRSSDIEMLGEEVAPYSDRYLALTSLARMMTEKGRETGANVMLRITANSVIRRYSELFHPEELDGCTIMVDYSEDNISRTMVAGDEEIILDDMEMYSKITAVYGEVSGRCEGLPSYPMIDRESMSADEFDDAVRALTAMGYDKYYVY